jgi:hypothetical protein
VIRDALFPQPLAQLAESDTGRLPDRVITILETSLNNKLNVAHQRRHDLAPQPRQVQLEALHHGEFRISRREVPRDSCSKSREDLGGWKVRGKEHQ